MVSLEDNTHFTPTHLPTRGRKEKCLKGSAYTVKTSGEIWRCWIERRGMGLAAMLIFKCAFSVFVDVSTNFVQLSCVKQFLLQTVIIGQHDRAFLFIIICIIETKIQI